MNAANFMGEAIAEAQKAKSGGDLPFGAVVVRGEEIVGRGHATDNTTGDVSDHAELRALRDACRTLGTNDLGDCIIYCTNQPCNMCAAGIFQAEIGHVVIGAMREDLSWLLRPRKIGIDELAADSGHAIKIDKGLCKDQVLHLFEYLRK